MEFQMCLGPETSNKEYKVCSLLHGNTINNEEALEAIKNCHWRFNNILKETLIVYLKRYLAKYIASFSNVMTLRSGDTASLYIGVDDNGVVNGIPYDGELTLDFLKDTIDYVFNTSLQFNTEQMKLELRQQLKIELIPVKYDKCKLKGFSNLHEEYIESSKKMENENKRHNNEVLFWSNIMKNENSKLSSMLDKERTEYRRTDHFEMKNSRSKYKNKYSHLYYLCDVPDYYDMLVYLKTSKLKSIGDSEIKNYKSVIDSSTMITKESLISDNTVFPSYQYNRVILFFLYARYKDYNINVLSLFKPKKSSRKKYSKHYPIILLSQSHRMMEPWLYHNNLNLYVLKIDVPLNTSNEERCNIKYFNEKKRKFESCYRGEDVNGPVTKKL